MIPGHLPRLPTGMEVLNGKHKQANENPLEEETDDDFVPLPRTLYGRFLPFLCEDVERDQTQQANLQKELALVKREIIPLKAELSELQIQQQKQEEELALVKRKITPLKAKLSEFQIQQQKLEEELPKVAKRIKTATSFLSSPTQKRPHPQPAVSSSSKSQRTLSFSSLEKNRLLYEMYQAIPPDQLKGQIYYRDQKATLIGFDEERNQFSIRVEGTEYYASNEELLFLPKEGETYLIQSVSEDPNKYRYFAATCEGMVSLKNNSACFKIHWLGLNQHKRRYLSKLSDLLPLPIDHPLVRSLKQDLVQVAGSVYPAYYLKKGSA